MEEAEWKKLIEGDKSCRAIAVTWAKATDRLLQYSQLIPGKPKKRLERGAL